jgi:hypothetical protein
MAGEEDTLKSVHNEILEISKADTAVKEKVRKYLRNIMKYQTALSATRVDEEGVRKSIEVAVQSMAPTIKFGTNGGLVPVGNGTLVDPTVLATLATGLVIKYGPDVANSIFKAAISSDRVSKAVEYAGNWINSAIAAFRSGSVAGLLPTPGTTTLTEADIKKEAAEVIEQLGSSKGPPARVDPNPTVEKAVLQELKKDLAETVPALDDGIRTPVEYIPATREQFGYWKTFSRVLAAFQPKPGSPAALSFEKQYGYKIENPPILNPVLNEVSVVVRASADQVKYITSLVFAVPMPNATFEEITKFNVTICKSVLALRTSAPEAHAFSSKEVSGEQRTALLASFNDKKIFKDSERAKATEVLDVFWPKESTTPSLARSLGLVAGIVTIGVLMGAAVRTQRFWEAKPEQNRGLKDFLSVLFEADDLCANQETVLDLYRNEEVWPNKRIIPQVLELIIKTIDELCRGLKEGDPGTGSGAARAHHSTGAGEPLVALKRLIDAGTGRYVQPRAVMDVLTKDAPFELKQLVLEYKEAGDLVPVVDLQSLMEDLKV